MKPLFTLLALSAPAFAAINITLDGTTESAVWTGLNNTNYTVGMGFPTHGTSTNPWPNAIAANSGSSAGATFNKVSGSGYFASGSLYDAGLAGTFHLADSGPQASLATIVFQADLGGSFASGPVLNINGGTQGLVPDYFATSPGSYLFSFGGPPGPTTNVAWQWELSGFGGSINSYKIVWSSANSAHLTQYQYNLATSDTFTQAIPEPSAGLLGVAALGLTLIRRRRA